MSLENFKNLNFHLYIPGDKDAPKRPKGVDPNVPRNITHEDMEKWLNNAGIDEDTKKALVKKLKSYPSSTLSHFYQNIHKHIAQVREKLRKKDN